MYGLFWASVEEIDLEIWISLSTRDSESSQTLIKKCVLSFFWKWSISLWELSCHRFWFVCELKRSILLSEDPEYHSTAFPNTLTLCLQEINAWRSFAFLNTTNPNPLFILVDGFSFTTYAYEIGKIMRNDSIKSWFVALWSIFVTSNLSLCCCSLCDSRLSFLIKGLHSHILPQNSMGFPINPIATSGSSKVRWAFQKFSLSLSFFLLYSAQLFQIFEKTQRSEIY